MRSWLIHIHKFRVLLFLVAFLIVNILGLMLLPLFLVIY
jgi:hypothetical protein